MIFASATFGPGISRKIGRPPCTARRELIWRGAIIGKEEKELLRFGTGPDELKIIMDNWEDFRTVPAPPR